ncbi:MAG: hypothetical protein EMLJLAPB_01075 [Candidatus Argoarchaeum ethanivorans]|uniref:Dockerin domain-containing protein n=1 Tax=Candidatus Argoarchaeum ethanivorans TaxID=2608793 RepID=A0A811THN1_9EURY|nr:MAG: hypothetical protein EMLJLAPB_01075 [Candidatus Argoarchaeum ethanivorans]
MNLTVTDNNGATNSISKTVTVCYEPLGGDLNSNGILDSADAAIALQIAVGSRPCDPETLAIADVSGDGRVSSLDALMILQMLYE